MADQKAQFDDYVVLKKYLAMQEPPTPKVSDEKKIQKPSGETPASQGFATMALTNSSRMSRGVPRGIPNLPPKVNCTPSTRMLKLYSNNQSTVTALNVTGNSLGGALGCVCYVANTTCRAVYATARIRSVTVWPGQEQAVLRNVCDLRWGTGPLAAINKDEDWTQVLPLGITSTKGMRFTPPAGTVCGDWMNLGSIGATVLFTMEISAGCVIIVDVEATLSNNITGATISLSGITAAIGTFGYTPLDGSGGSIQPLGITPAF